MTTELNWILAAQADDISPDTNTLRVVINGEAVCLYQLEDGSVHATQDRCTHGNASLADGYIEDGLIECPLHQGCFDIRTGKARTAPCTIDLKTYAVKVEGDTIYVAGEAA